MENLVNRVKEIIKNKEYLYYGLRKDECEYKVGDICNKSHQLWQDAEYDWNTGELLYPLIEDGPYAGFYDEGELDGTCAIEVTLDNVEEKIKFMKTGYLGKHLHLIASDYAGYGNDIDEIILRDAVVIDVLY